MKAAADSVSSDSLGQQDECHPSSDSSAAIRLFPGRWDWEKILSAATSVISPPASEENQSEPEGADQKDQQDQQDAEGAAEPPEEEEEEPCVPFQSKYLHIFPLYQDYHDCLHTLRDDLHRITANTFLSELIAPDYLRGLQERLGGGRSSSDPPPSPPAPASPIRVAPSTLWQDLDEVKASGLLQTLSRSQIRLHECTFELIGSEASYLRSLGVAVDHFCASKYLRSTVSPREHHILFSNIRRVKAASQRFLMDLEQCLGENVLLSEVGSVVLKHCPAFHDLYVPYVTNMTYQEELLRHLLEHNRSFVFCLKRLEADAVCQRQNLKSFLVLPFQRITRIKLILESVLKLTEPDAASVADLEKAKECVHEIILDCDRNVKRMKQIEELVCLETMLDFGNMKALPLVVSGRFLLHHGPMRQLVVENTRTSFTSVYLHLFNDLLLISSKREQSFLVQDHAQFPAHVHLENLKAQLLGLPSESFLLRLSLSHTGHATAIILATYTRAEKDVWMRFLSSEQ